MSTLFVTAPGQPKPFELEIDLGAPTHELVRQVLNIPKDVEIHERFVFQETGGEPLSLELTLRENGASEDSCFHVHPCRTVAVGVRYNTAEATGDFAPNSTAAEVVRWASAQEKFNIAPADRVRLELRTEKNVPITNDQHIGAYIENDRCGATFVMVEHPKVQG